VSNNLITESTQQQQQNQQHQQQQQQQEIASNQQQQQQQQQALNEEQQSYYNNNTFYNIQPPILQLFFSKLNKSAIAPISLGNNTFAFCLPFQITIKPNQQKDISLHLSLFFPLHCNTIYRPCKTFVSQSPSIQMSLLNIIDGSVYVSDFVIRIRNLSTHTSVTLPRKTILYTVKLQNLYCEIQPIQIKQLVYSYSSENVNGSVFPVF
jgi:hypothetical protein